VIVLAEFDDPSVAGVVLDGDLGFVASESAELDDVGRGVRRARVYAGHSGWGPGQLEGELEEESWIVEPPQREEIFAGDAEGLWAAVLRRKGREYALLSTMPPDPSVN
jgi:putative transcriptional regulator